MITNCVMAIVSALVMMEGNPSGKPADQGRSRGVLCIHSAMVADYNKDTGSKLVHHDVDDPEVAYEVARWFVEKHRHRVKNITQLGMIWNRGLQGYKNGEGKEYGERLSNLVASNR